MIDNNDNDNIINVVVYSKFSHASTKLIGLIDKNPALKQNTHMLCVDNTEARKRIAKSQKLNIKYVPCIMRLYEKTGYVETFEGEKAFTLVNTYYIEYLEKLNSQQPPQQIQPQPPIQQIQPQSTPMNQKPKQQNSTPLGNLMELDDDDDGDDNNNNIENLGLNTYLHIPTHLEGQNTNMPTIERAVKKDSGGSGNIVSRAMQMQKERDSETSSNAPKIPLN